MGLPTGQLWLDYSTGLPKGLSAVSVEIGLLGLVTLADQCQAASIEAHSDQYILYTLHNHKYLTLNYMALLF